MSSQKRVVYFTRNTPFGRQESFVLSELCALREQGYPIQIIPRQIEPELFHIEAKSLVPHTLQLPLLSAQILIQALAVFLRSPFRVTKIVLALFRTKGLRNFCANLVVLPKALYLTRKVDWNDVVHIHAHWGTAVSTMAAIVSELVSVEWSLTLHRGDIQMNNLLDWKARSAKFVRCISRDGLRMLRERVDDLDLQKVQILHMGVSLREEPTTPKYFRSADEEFRILVPASYLPVKGHEFLIRALALLRDRGIQKFQCVCHGEGPLKSELQELIDELDLGQHIELRGMVSSQAITQMLNSGAFHCVVLPSILTEDGQHEGIPVCLMEAMSVALPTISTQTGGIPELLAPDFGVLVPDKNSERLAAEIANLIESDDLCRQLGERGQRRVIEDFNSARVSHNLWEHFGGPHLQGTLVSSQIEQ